MSEPTADEVYEQFKEALRTTVTDTWADEEILKFQCENGMADWALNDEEHVLLAGISRNSLAKILCHVVVLTYGAEERYIAGVEEEAAQALQEVEDDEESSEEEKILATELIEVASLAQVDGYSHCVALIHGWALAAISADEGETVDWDSIFQEKADE
jgi:hypothetical protein